MRRVFITTCVCLFAVGYVFTLAVGSYWSIPVTELLSFRVGDGHCNPITSGFGAHCFGDYQLPLQNIKSRDYWGSNAYPPLALLPFFLASFVARFFDDRVVLALYLSSLYIAMLVPAVYVARKLRSDYSNIVGLIIVGVAAHPVVMSIDRGSSVGFALPLLLLFAVSVKSNSIMAVIAAGLLVSWRPQYLLLLLIFIGIGQMRRLFQCAAVVCFTYVASFVLIPGNFLSNFGSWKIGISEHGRVDQLFEDGVAKVSTARGVLHLVRFLGELHPVLEESGLFYLEISYGKWFSPGYFLAGLTAFVFFRVSDFKDVFLKLVIVLALSALVFPITFGYYNIFAVIVGALIMLESGPKFLTSTEISTGKIKFFVTLLAHHWWELLVVAATAVTLAPIPIPTSVAEQTIIIEYSGLIWTTVVLSGLVKLWSNSISMRSMN